MAPLKKKSIRPITEDRFREIMEETINIKVPPIIEDVLDAKFKAHGIHGEKQMQELITFVSSSRTVLKATRDALIKALFGISLIIVIWLATTGTGL